MRNGERACTLERGGCIRLRKTDTCRLCVCACGLEGLEDTVKVLSSHFCAVVTCSGGGGLDASLSCLPLLPAQMSICTVTSVLVCTRCGRFWIARDWLALLAFLAGDGKKHLVSQWW